jgi:hypothetical protein
MGNQSCAESMAMSSSVNDTGVYHPHMNSQHGPQMLSNEQYYRENYAAKISDGGLGANK